MKGSVFYKTYFAVVSFLLLSFNSTSQMQRSSIHSISYKSAQSKQTQVLVDQNRICYVTPDSKNLSVRIELSDSLLFEGQLPLKQIYGWRNRGYGIHAVFVANKLAIFAGKKMLLYACGDEASLKRVDKKRLSQSYDYFTKSNDAIYAYTYHALDRNFKQGELFTYQIATKKSTKQRITIDFPMATCISPNNYFDPLYGSNDNAFLLSDVGHYRILLYENGALSDSITLADDSLFVPISTKDSIAYKREQRNHQSLQDITQTNSDIRERNGHIWSVFYLDKNTIFVRLSNPIKPNDFELIDHLWVKVDGGWALKAVKKNNPYWHESNEFWPYFSMYNRMLKDETSLCYFHFASCAGESENFTTKDYFDPTTLTNNLCYYLWRFNIR